MTLVQTEIKGMLTFARVQFLGILFILSAKMTSAAWAEPTPVEACNYFLADVSIIGSARNATHVIAKMPEFDVVQMDLERYLTFSATDLRVEFGQVSSQAFSKLGELSVGVKCVVDIVERRVIRIAIGDGQAVGEETVNAAGDIRKIGPPNQVVVEIANGPHGGRY